MPRLFTGFEIPAAVASELALLRGGLSGARWIEPADYHLTLRFAGNMDNAVAREFAAGLESRPYAPFEIVFERISAFGGDRPRAIVVEAKLTTEFTMLQADHERAARAAGISPERRKFIPHVTLARLGSGMHVRDVAGYLESRGLPRPIVFTPERFVLFSSRGSIGGGPYVVEAAYGANGAFDVHGLNSEAVTFRQR